MHSTILLVHILELFTHPMEASRMFNYLGLHGFLCQGIISISCTTKSFLPLMLLFKNILVPALLYFENILKDEHLLDAKVEKMKLANGKYES